jgi:restriction system protein
LGGDPERERILKSGGNAAENEVAWARNNLREAGLIDGGTRGIWKLTPEGWQTHFNLDQARNLGRNAKIRTAKYKESITSEEIEDPAANLVEEEKPTLLETIRQLPPVGFEQLCKRILYASGFVQVDVTKQSGDGGIDGIGVLQLNELVSFKVVFQCKRYQGTVGSGELRDFRGAMQGRADKGIFITTGSFSADAQKEASRDGVPPIELVDQDKLISLMERLELGVKPRVVYDVDDQFFEPFRRI